MSLSNAPLSNTQSTPTVRVVKRPVARNIAKVLRTILAVGILAAGYWALEHWLQHGGEDHAKTESGKTPELAELNEVVLTPEKLSNVHFEQSVCTKRKLSPILSVPGRIEYEPKRRLELKAPTPAVVRKIFAQQGSTVAQGDPLILIDSEEIGLARAELHNHREEEGLREAEYARACEIERSIEELQQQFASDTTAAELEAIFKDKPMGQHRESLFSTYSQYLLAKSLAENIKDMDTGGALSTRLILERKSQLEVADAAFRSAREQSIYNSQKAVRESSAALKYARDLTAVSARKLAVLAGNFSLPPEEVDAPGHLTELTLRAPFAGSVVESFVQQGGRINVQEPIFVLADTSRLRVSVEVRENQWNALKVEKGEQLQLRTPAIPDRQFPCTMEFVSAGLSADTRSVPLIASLENSEGLFKPGMLVWVDIPAEETPEVLSVPDEAVQVHDNRKFVFVPEGEGRYTRREVTIGREDGTLAEVVDGLTDGTPVITEGAFVLKSGLLLKPED